MTCTNCRHCRPTNSPEPVIHKTSNERFPKARCKLSKKKPKLSIPLVRILIRDVFSYTCIQSVKSRNTRRRCSKLTIKTSERRHWRLYYDIFIVTSLLWRHWRLMSSGVFIVNFKHTSPFSSDFIVDFEQGNFAESFHNYYRMSESSEIKENLNELLTPIN